LKKTCKKVYFFAQNRKGEKRQGIGNLAKGIFIGKIGAIKFTGS